jgi:ABC-2 type transport system permease protein
LLYLLRDRVALVLTFVLPLLFFSVFAVAFSSMDDAGSGTVETLLVVEAEPSSFAARLGHRLASKPGIEVVEEGPRDRESALEAVRSGRASVAVVLPSGLRPSFLDSGGESEPVELYADRSNPLAIGLVSGHIQGSAAELMATDLAPAASSEGPVRIEVFDALGRSGKRPSISFFAAGLGVMFLMFAVTGRSSILIEERESGVLGRLLAARVGMTRLLCGRWLFLVILGALQVLAMFLWAAFAFGLELFTPHHLAGFALTTLATAAAAAAFGLILSAACRSRAQLNGVGVVVVLLLSVVGGNMFPSFLMPSTLQSVGRLAFNAWALEAYRKVFWYERPLAELTPQLASLATATLVFLALARWIARGWERSGGGRV